MELINQVSRSKLSPSDLYTFSIRLCDNEVDRDMERFTADTLEGLAKLFVGKCGVFYDKWKGIDSTARIYRTELVKSVGIKTEAGDEYCYLKGYAYMLRTGGNRELIAEIESGIKKEVSVGCSVEKSLCSICGNESEGCAHVKGKRYGGELCWKNLVGATDAYEWSFEATPVYIGAIGRDGAELWRQRMQ